MKKLYPLVVCLVVIGLVLGSFGCAKEAPPAPGPAPASAPGKTIIDEWSVAKAPPPPELKSVTVDPKTTALLILDIEERTANMERRPRAVASVPGIQELLERTRQAGMTVVFSTTSGGTPETILPEVTPREGEPVVKSSVNKFYNTNLDEILQDKGIKSVIVTGTAAEGAVLNTAIAAAIRGLEVIVPVDCLSSSELYAEQYVCWHLVNAPGSRNRTTLTKTSMIEITQ
ncbi:cysteine hydrolase [Chloroflexota bacterium]